MADWPHPSSNWAYIYATPLTPNKFHIYENTYIYILKADGPPLQSTIAACKTITPNKFHTQENPHVYCRQMGPHSIDHSCMQNHYTTQVWHIGQCTCIPKADGPPPVEHRCLENHYIKQVWHIGQCTYIPKADGPPGQLTIGACKTITPNQFHI